MKIHLLSGLAVLWAALICQPAFASNHTDEFENPVVGLSEGLDGCLHEALTGPKSSYECIGYTTKFCLQQQENQTTIGMEKCHLDELAGWDALLNRYYQTIRQGDAFPQLRDTQRQWIAYRNSKCDLYEAFYQGGSMARWLRADCMRQETARRAIDLFFFAVEIEGR